MDRQTDEQRATASLSDVELVGGRVPNRIMLLPIGPIEASDGRRWKVDGRAHAEQIVAATQKHLGRRGFMMDYDHQAVLAPKHGGRAAAAGWVAADGFTVEDDGIYGEVEWTAAARSQLKDREYRYISPHFGHHKDGRITRLFNAALTNTPAMDMPALASADQDSTQEHDMDKIIEQLGLEAGADEDTIVSAIASLQTSTSLTPIAAALGLAEDATAEDVETAATAAAARPEAVDLTAVASALDLGAEASVEELATAAAALKAGTIDPAKYVPIETHQALQALVDQDGEQKATAAVDAAIAAGKIAPANRDYYLGHARADLTAFQAFAVTAPAVLAAGESDDTAGDRQDAGQLTDEERSTCSIMGVSEEQFLAAKKEAE